VARYLNPSFWVNNLGINVGGNAYDTSETTLRFCNSPAFSYESGYQAGDGANGVWEVDILINGQPAKTFGTRVTFLEQIESLAPDEAQSLLTNTLLAAGGVGLLGYRKGKVFFTPQVVNTVTVRARLINYAFGVHRIGYRTVHHTGGVSYATGGGGWCPGADPGYQAGNNCESCCGNVSCLSTLFFGNKLFTDDPLFPRTRQILWQGEATYTVKDDPYKRELSVGMGRVIDAFFFFDLAATMSTFAVDISKDE
jgi:hypothetical protein